MLGPSELFVSLLEASPLTHKVAVDAKIGNVRMVVLVNLDGVVVKFHRTGDDSEPAWEERLTHGECLTAIDEFRRAWDLMLAFQELHVADPANTIRLTDAEMKR